MSAEPILSQKIRYYRKLYSMTQKDLAVAIGVEPLHIVNIENGKKGISLDKLLLICKHFNISLADILPIDEQDDSELRKLWTQDLLNAIVKLDTSQLGMVRSMICSLVVE